MKGMLDLNGETWALTLVVAGRRRKHRRYNTMLMYQGETTLAKPKETGSVHDWLSIRKYFRWLSRNWSIRKTETLVSYSGPVERAVRG